MVSSLGYQDVSPGISRLTGSIWCCEVIAHALCLATTHNCKAGITEHGMGQHLVIKVVKGPSQFLLSVFGRLCLVDARSVVGRVPSECDVQGLQESIHSSQQTLRLARRCSSAWLTIVDNDAIC